MKNKKENNICKGIKPSESLSHFTDAVLGVEIRGLSKGSNRSTIELDLFQCGEGKLGKIAARL